MAIHYPQAARICPTVCGISTALREVCCEAENWRKIWGPVPGCIPVLMFAACTAWHAALEWLAPAALYILLQPSPYQAIDPPPPPNSAPGSFGADRPQTPARPPAYPDRSRISAALCAVHIARHVKIHKQSVHALHKTFDHSSSQKNWFRKFLFLSCRGWKTASAGCVLSPKEVIPPQTNSTVCSTLQATKTATPHERRFGGVGRSPPKPPPPPTPKALMAIAQLLCVWPWRCTGQSYPDEGTSDVGVANLGGCDCGVRVRSGVPTKHQRSPGKYFAVLQHAALRHAAACFRPLVGRGGGGVTCPKSHRHETPLDYSSPMHPQPPAKTQHNANHLQLRALVLCIRSLPLRASFVASSNRNSLVHAVTRPGHSRASKSCLCCRRTCAPSKHRPLARPVLEKGRASLQ